MRRRFRGLLVAVIALTPMAEARVEPRASAAPLSGAKRDPGAAVPVVIIDGQGWGHGVGMAQDGAFWMAKAGASTSQILGQFYPGTSLAKMTTSDVRVAVFSGIAITVEFPAGGRIDERTTGPQSSTGFPVHIDRGGLVRVRWSGTQVIVEPLASARVDAPATTTTTTPATTTTIPAEERSADILPESTTTTSSAPPQSEQSAQSAPPSSVGTAQTLVLTPFDNGTINHVERGRRYRGFVDVVPTGAGLRLVNQLNVEQYLRGMGEVRDPRWPAAALRTQAVAARTYALRAMAAAGEICDTQRCQVYLGQQAEYGAMDKAVAATAGQVLMFNRGLASAVYSANAGGHSATREEGFGTTGGNYPYLRAAPYETKNPMPWSVTLNVRDVGTRLGRPNATTVRVVGAGPSGRALSVALDGPDGGTTVTGRAFAAALGLRSTMFAVRMGTADVAPAPPAGGFTLQAPPDEVAAADAAVTNAASAPDLVASRFALPDRPQPLTAPTPASTAVSTPGAVAALLLILVLLLAASWRRPALVASLRSLRGVRPRAGDHR